MVNGLFLRTKNLIFKVLRISLIKFAETKKKLKVTKEDIQVYINSLIDHSSDLTYSSQNL